MKRRAGFLAAGLLGVALVGAWLWRAQESTFQGRADAVADAGLASEDDAPASPAAATRRPAPLPPADAPLALILGPLQERADRGEGKAACRLALELVRCAQIRWWDGVQTRRASSFYDEAQHEKAGRLDAADQAAMSNLWHLERMQACTAVSDDLLARRGDYLRQAALAGEPEAMLRYADGQHFPMDARGVFADPGFEAWRREAPVMLQRALASGHPDAVLQNAFARMSDFGYLASLVPDDMEQAQAYMHLYTRVYGRPEPLGTARLGIESQRRVREMSARLHQQYFNGRTFTRPLMIPMLFSRHAEDPTDGLCQDVPSSP